MSKKKKENKKKSSFMYPMFPLIIVERVNHTGETAGGILVPRREQEETLYAIVYENGNNADFEIGDILMVGAHCGHDVWLDDGMALTILDPDDIMAKVEMTAKELNTIREVNA